MNDHPKQKILDEPDDLIYWRDGVPHVIQLEVSPQTGKYWELTKPLNEREVRVRRG